MAISELSVSGYRSILDIELKLGRLNVLVGPNGCGKTNLYRSMLLLQAAAEGGLAATLASEGGMPSVLWAGPRKKGPVRLKLGVTAEQIRYQIECGLPQSHNISKDESTRFKLDPEIKEEGIWFIGAKPVKLLERGKGGTCWVADDEGRRADFRMAFASHESAVANLLEPHRYPHVMALRREMLRWRFYHHFRTDDESPIRRPQVGTRTFVLSHDGRDLAAALQTIIENGDDQALNQSLDEAFSGAQLYTTINDTLPEPDLGSAATDGFMVALKMPGISRPMLAQELSDGTLRYLCLLAALLSPRPPSVLAINEPETSLHPDLLQALARLIVRAAESTQVWITTHSEKLAGCIQELSGIKPIALEKVAGETRIVGYQKYVFEDE